MKLCPQCNNPNYNSVTSCVECGYSFPQRPKPPYKQVSNWIAVAIILIVSGTIVAVFIGGFLHQQSKQEILNKIDVRVNTALGGFGTVLKADIDVWNNSDYPLKDFVISCDAVGGSGTKLETLSKTVYEVVPSKGHRTFEDINFGFVNSQAKSFRCGLDDATIYK